jgi:predicted O-methyltransferase YrrM
MIIGANMPWQYIQTESGLILPWFTLPCLEWLVKQDISKWVVFEFGCGYSTIWFRKNVNVVFSIDNNSSWAKAMTAYHTETKEKYISGIKLLFPTTPEKNDLFDCIVIDGAWRLECLQNSHDRVRSGGYIIIDNWEGEDFPHTKEALEILNGWECQIFKQPNHRTWKTVVFRKS